MDIQADDDESHARVLPRGEGGGNVLFDFGFDARFRRQMAVTDAVAKTAMIAAPILGLERRLARHDEQQQFDPTPRTAQWRAPPDAMP
jgi:hypothetical protein